MPGLTPFAKYQPSQDSQSWLVDGILTEGGTSLLVGEPKAGKSQLARHLIHSFLSKESFLDRQIMSKGKIFYFALEEQPYELAKQLLELGVSRDSEDLLVGDRSWHSKSPFEELEEHIKAYSPKLCIIDPFVAFTQMDDLNDYAKVYEAIRKLVQLGQRYGTHILIVHHKNKSDGPPSRQIMGSQGFYGAVDTALFLSGEDNQKTVLVKPRYGSKLNLQLSMTPTAIKDVMELGRSELNLSERILADLAKHPEGIEQRILAKGSGHGRFQAEIGSLVASGAVIKERSSTNKPYVLRLPSSVPPKPV